MKAKWNILVDTENSKTSYMNCPNGVIIIVSSGEFDSNFIPNFNINEEHEFVDSPVVSYQEVYNPICPRRM